MASSFIKQLSLMKFKLLFAVTLLLSTHIYGQSNQVLSETQRSILLDKTSAFPENTEFSIVFIKNGEVKYFGAIRTNDTLAYSDNTDHLFEIGSITKVFTSTLLAELVLENEIDLNTPIQDYFDYPIANKEITVLQLANHTSGLPRLPSNLDLDMVDQSNPYNDYSKEDLKTYLAEELVLDNEPGTNYEYSNVGAGILGYLLEVHTELSYEELLKKYVLSKYQMTNTTTSIDAINTDLVEGLDSEGNTTSNWNLNALVGAGGIISNVKDLSKFALQQFDSENKGLKLTQQSTFEIPAYRMEVGLAWNIIKPDAAHTWFMHNGGTGGYSSIMALDTENKNGIIILSNVSSFNMNARNIDQLCLALMQTQY